EGGEQGWAHGKPRPFGAASGSSQGGDGVVWSQWFEGALGGGGFRPPRARRAPRHHHSDTTSLRRRTNVATVKFPGRLWGRSGISGGRAIAERSVRRELGHEYQVIGSGPGARAGGGRRRARLLHDNFRADRSGWGDLVRSAHDAVSGRISIRL